MIPKFDFNDILIQPEIGTEINSRKKEIDIYYQHNSGKHLPLITAPMDTVVNGDNSIYYSNLDINICYPRGEGGIKFPEIDVPNLRFESVSLKEFEEIIKPSKSSIDTIANYSGRYYVCIDTANGHLNALKDAIIKAKSLYGDYIVIMAGNIANPKTFRELSLAGADYIRCGIGNGNACLTTQQTGVGYPVASLVQECRIIKVEESLKSKIVADGGMKDYSDIIKALALGADYVMVGSVFNKALESCGETSWSAFKLPINQYSLLAKWLFKNKFSLYKNFRGMSTKEVQKKWGKEELTTSEGVSRYRKVEYTLGGWTHNFQSYLKTAMSYTNSKTLKDFIGNVQVNQITQNAYQRFNK